MRASRHLLGAEIGIIALVDVACWCSFRVSIEEKNSSIKRSQLDRYIPSLLADFFALLCTPRALAPRTLPELCQLRCGGRIHNRMILPAVAARAALATITLAAVQLGYPLESVAEVGYVPSSNIEQIPRTTAQIM